MVGEALVADLRGRAAVDAAALADAALRPGDILLCRTDNSERWAAPDFQRDFTYLTRDAAELLVERGVRAVGIDYLSIEQFGSTDFPGPPPAARRRASSSSRDSTCAPSSRALHARLSAAQVSGSRRRAGAGGAAGLTAGWTRCTSSRTT